MQLALYWPKQLTYPLELWPTPARLEHESERERLLEAIIEACDVTKACKSLGMSRASVYRYVAKNPSFAAEFDVAKKMAAEIAFDECIRLADEMPSANDWGKTKLRIETRVRVASKLLAYLQDKPTTQINLNDNRMVVVTDEKRKQLQERLRLLQESTESNGSKTN